MVNFIVVDKLTKIVKPSGTSAHAVVSKKYIGKEANIIILAPMPFICKSCAKTIDTEDNFSPNPKLCKGCYNKK